MEKAEVSFNRDPGFYKEERRFSGRGGCAVSGYGLPDEQ